MKIFLTLFFVFYLLSLPVCPQGGKTYITPLTSFPSEYEELKITKTLNSTANTDSSFKKRKIFAYATTAVLGTGSLLWLGSVWYAPYSTGNFHFFDDHTEWLQMDKIGHIYAGYQLTRILSEIYAHSGISNPEYLSLGGTLIYLSSIEIMDGFSQGWGFSNSDFWANIVGAGLGYVKVRYTILDPLHVKFSYIPYSDIYRQRPSLLGKNWPERLIKDYNNQVYWLAISPFAQKGKFPLSALLFALGYGADGMLSGHPQPGEFPKRKRNIYLSVDLDLEKIPVRSRFLKKCFLVLNILKIPAPALQFSREGIFFLPFR